MRKPAQPAFRGHKPIEPRVPLLSHLAYRPRLPEAIRDLLRDPAADAKRFGKLPGVKRLRQRTGDQPNQVGRRPQAIGAMHRQQFLVFDLMIVGAPPAASAMARIPPLLNVDQGHFQRQPRVWKYAGEMHELGEQIEDLPALRAHPPGDDRPILARPLDQVFADDDWLDHHDPMVFEQGSYLIADGGERPVLDLHQTAAGDGVDAESVERDLEPGIRRA